MDEVSITFLPSEKTIQVTKGTNLLSAQIAAGLRPNAPCGGRGSCGKCMAVVSGQEVLACQTKAEQDAVVTLPDIRRERVLTNSVAVQAKPDGAHCYVIAFDIGTTTVAVYLLNGITGEVLAQTGMRNPQAQFGADVISRIQLAMNGERHKLTFCIRQTLAELAEKAAAEAGINLNEVTLASIVGNTAMHHLLLDIDVTSLTVPPYMPKMFQELELPAKELLPISESGIVRILPNIAGFVGADTVGASLVHL